MQGEGFGEIPRKAPTPEQEMRICSDRNLEVENFVFSRNYYFEV